MSDAETIQVLVNACEKVLVVAELWNARPDLIRPSHLVNECGLLEALSIAKGDADVDRFGHTSEEYLEHEFCSEYCDVCGGDKQHHVAGLHEGQWYVVCLYPKNPFKKGWHPEIAKFRREEIIKSVDNHS